MPLTSRSSTGCSGRASRTAPRCPTTPRRTAGSVTRGGALAPEGVTMPDLRSRTVTHGRNMAGARALLRATGVAAADIGKPIIAVANSFTEFVPGHTHLQPVGRIVSEAIHAAGGIAREFNTIAVDDGIAMGHGGMLYSLPSRDLIADSVEYMVNAHRADALVCISNCDKITPGMLMAALRLNIPAVFVSGGPMEGGTAVLVDGTVRRGVHLIDAMADAVSGAVSDEDLARVEEAACPTCGSCSGMFTANSMNCLMEALGLALPGNGTVLATHTARRALYEAAGATAVELCRRWYETDDASVLPRSVASRAAFENSMALDIAMGGSTNTVLHMLAAAHEAELDFTMADIDALSRRVPCICKVAPSGSYLMEDVHRAGGIPAILGELHRAGLLREDVHAVHAPSLAAWLKEWDVRGGSLSAEAVELFHAAPGGVRSSVAGSQSARWEALDDDAAAGCIRDVAHAYSADGGLAVLRGNLAVDGCVVDIDIPGRVSRLRVDDGVLAARRAAVQASGGYRPRDRDRAVSPALRAYAAMATSADKGAVRDVPPCQAVLRHPGAPG